MNAAAMQMTASGRGCLGRIGVLVVCVAVDELKLRLILKRRLPIPLLLGLRWPARRAGHHACSTRFCGTSPHAAVYPTRCSIELEETMSCKRAKAVHDDEQLCETSARGPRASGSNATLLQHLAPRSPHDRQTCTGSESVQRHKQGMRSNCEQHSAAAQHVLEHWKVLLLSWHVENLGDARNDASVRAELLFPAAAVINRTTKSCVSLASMQPVTLRPSTQTRRNSWSDIGSAAGWRVTL
jgi:hypothetical protein